MALARGPSTATKKAERFFAKTPTATARELANKFGIDTATIYRAEWWKNRTAAQKKSAE